MGSRARYWGRGAKIVRSGGRRSSGEKTVCMRVRHSIFCTVEGSGNRKVCLIVVVIQQHALCVRLHLIARPLVYQ